MVAPETNTNVFATSLLNIHRGTENRILLHFK